MPQEMHVLRCYNCDAFQVHIVKKIPKWECKICCEKQSIIKVYEKGSGKDCRLYVQRLNQHRFECNEEPENLNDFPSHIESNTTNEWEEFMTHDQSGPNINLLDSGEWNVLNTPLESHDTSNPKDNCEVAVTIRTNKWEEFLTPTSSEINLDKDAKKLNSMDNKSGNSTNTCSSASNYKVAFETNKWEEFLTPISKVNLSKDNNEQYSTKQPSDSKNTFNLKSNCNIFESNENNLDDLLNF